MSDQAVTQIRLPDRLMSSADLARTLRELEALDDSLRQSALRKPGEPTHLSRSSITLEELAQLNGIQLTDPDQREQLVALVKAFELHAPRIHMSLAAEPSARFTSKVVVWMRQNIHPLTLVEIGLQPNIAAGCVLRTNNRIFDMSLRHRFDENRNLLLQKITEVGVKHEEVAESAAIEEAVVNEAQQAQSAEASTQTETAA